MKRAWMVSLLALGISTSAICADATKPADKAAAAQVKDDSQDDHESKVERHVTSMTTDLKLSKPQADSVRKVLEDSREKNKALRKEMNEKRRALKEETDAKVAAILKPDQKKKFLELQDGKSEGRKMSKDATDK